MSSRMKIAAAVAAACLMVGMLAFGVFAATNPTGQTSNSVSFTSKSVYATVTGTVSDEKGGDYASLGYREKNYTDKTGASLTAFPAWNIGDIRLEEDNAFVEYTVTVQNDSGFAILASGNVPSAPEGLNVTINRASAVVAAEGSETFIIRISVADMSKSFTQQPMNFSFTLEKAAA